MASADPYLVGEGAGIRTLNLGLKSPARTVHGCLQMTVLYLVGRRECPCKYMAGYMRPCGIRGLVRGLDALNQGVSLGVETKEAPDSWFIVTCTNAMQV